MKCIAILDRTFKIILFIWNLHAKPWVFLLSKITNDIIINIIRRIYKSWYDYQSVQSMTGRLSCNKTALKRCTIIIIIRIFCYLFVTIVTVIQTSCAAATIFRCPLQMMTSS